MDEEKVDARRRARAMFGKRLQLCRRAAGYETARDFVKAFPAEYNLAEHAYRRYERGEVEPPFDILPEIARRVHRSIDFLVTGRTPRNEPELYQANELDDDPPAPQRHR